MGEKTLDIRQYALYVSLSPEEIWTGPPSPALSYPEGGNDFYLQIENKSFWFRHRNQCLLSVFHHFPPGEFLLDVGGGNGFVALFLSQNGFPTAMLEPGLTGARNAKNRGLPWILQCGFEQAGFKDHCLPSVGLFDVLEHIEDAPGFLRMIKSKLKKEGRVYLTVPAFPWLWSQEDRWAGHYRRYSTKGLRRLLEGEGFQVEYLSYFFFFLVPPLFLFRVLPYRLGFWAKTSPRAEAYEHAVSGLVKTVLEKTMDFERRRIGSRTMPFGTSCIAVATL